MARHSFIRIVKIDKVRGRINYISSQAKQENLYATMNTANSSFWRNLAKESQQEFQKSGSGGKCIEARELIIALPEVYTKYDPQQVLEVFTKTFQDRHQVECVSALHHNKKKTNYHIHLIFSERQLLKEPEVKIASRNMFYNEQGKHVRTKKEILDNEGNVRNGCKIIAKGEVYEKRLFTNKNLYFKSDRFLAEEKKHYTELMNQYIKNPVEKLGVFDKNSIYLPTKKIGKNNPKAQEIRADNDARTQWNQVADLALVEGMPETEVIKIKRAEITAKVWKPIEENGKQPGLFRKIVLKAKEILTTFIRKLIMPPKPVLTVDIVEFRKMEDIKSELDQQRNAIYVLEEKKLPDLKRQLNELKGVFKGKERRMLKDRIADAEEGLSTMKSHLTRVVTRYGYQNIQDFMSVYAKSEHLVRKYQKDLHEWKSKSGETTPKKESIRSQIKKLQEEAKNKSSTAYPLRKDKGAR